MWDHSREREGERESCELRDVVLVDGIKKSGHFVVGIGLLLSLLLLRLLLSLLLLGVCAGETRYKMKK